LGILYITIKNMGIIEVLQQQQQLNLHFNILFYGTAATQAIADSCIAEINKMWNAPKATIKYNNSNYFVQFIVKGFLNTQLTPNDIANNRNPKNNYIRIEDNTPVDVSFVDGLQSNTGFFKTDNLFAGSTTAAHEFGHLLGLDHPKNLDYRGQGAPSIMYPRGTLVDAPYQYNPAAQAGDGANGGTMNPSTRVVKPTDVEQLQLHTYNLQQPEVVFGWASNIYHTP
jgi:hypothetical protein